MKNPKPQIRNPTAAAAPGLRETRSVLDLVDGLPKPFFWRVASACGQSLSRPACGRARQFAVALLLLSTMAAFPLSLTNVRREADGVVAFELNATTGSTNTIEAVPSLTGFWYPLISGIATNGAFPYVHFGASNFQRLFYRARAGGEEPADNVTFQTDPNLSAMTLIIPEAGGQCQVTTPDWIRFTLRVPSNALPEPAIISMTVITNITPSPGTNPPVAVQLEPSGLMFNGAAELEILFPSNRPPGLSLSYSFGTNGSAIHLVPDLLSPNRVLIPVTHFSGFGSGQFTPHQVSTYMRKALDNSTARMHQRIASILGHEREQQLNSQWNTPDRPAEIRAIADEYFQEVLRPALEAAAVNCGLAQTAIPTAGGFIRTREILGFPDDDQKSYVQQKICEAFENCDSELDNECGTTLTEELLRRAMANEKSREINGCGVSPRDWSTRFTNCIGQWSGIIRVTETGSTNETVGNLSQSGQYHYSYTAYLTDGIEDVSSPDTFIVTGRLEVDASSSEESVQTVHFAKNCPSSPGQDQTTTRSLLGIGPLRQLLQVYVIAGQVFSISTVTDPAASTNLSALAMTGQESFVTVYQHCDGTESRTTVTQNATDEGAPPLLGALMDVGDIQYHPTNSIRGTFTTTDARYPAGGNLETPTTVRWTVELRRRP